MIKEILIGYAIYMTAFVISQIISTKKAQKLSDNDRNFNKM